MSLDWSLDVKRDANNKTVKVVGNTTVGGSKVRAVVTADGVAVTFKGTVRESSPEELTELAKVLTDLQSEIE